MIKWEHSIFALPFALCGAMLAASGHPSLRQVLWIIVAMVGARSAAMAFNRLADAEIDARNPRTAMRALPAGQLSRSFVILFVLVSSAVLTLAAWELNRLALYLSPLALAIIFMARAGSSSAWISVSKTAIWEFVYAFSMTEGKG